MTASSLAVVVAALCLAAAAGGATLTEGLARRRRGSLRGKLVALFVGLLGAEALSLPALVVALAGEEVTGLAAAGFEVWLVAALYVLLTAYVLGRLFPWREVDAMVSGPDATVRGVLARLTAARDDRDDD